MKTPVAVTPYVVPANTKFVAGNLSLEIELLSKKKTTVEGRTTDGRTDGRADGRKEGRTDGRTEDGRKDGRADGWKSERNENERTENGRTEGRTEGHYRYVTIATSSSPAVIYFLPSFLP